MTGRVMPTDGWAAVAGEPVPRLVEEIADARPWMATWLDPPFRPEPPEANQAYGLCIVESGQIVLICSHDDGVGDYWNLPGGGVEPGETLEQCLVREIAEEACADVLQLQYLGCQRVDEPHHPAGPRRYYQTRFWARVRLNPWAPEHETYARRLVGPAEFLETLTWGSAATAAVILEEGLRLDAHARAGSD